MRIWSLHPRHLDTIGLVALWREALLAKHVLEGKTKGYTRHPQLARFRNSDSPVEVIDLYLKFVYIEAKSRGFKFDASKIAPVENVLKLTVTSGQIEFERQHLLKKLKIRQPLLYKEFVRFSSPEVHPLFVLVPGEIELWEVLTHKD